MRDWEGEGDRNVELVTEGEGTYRNNKNNNNNNQLVLVNLCLAAQGLNYTEFKIYNKE